MLILLPPSEGKAAARRGQRLDLDRLSAPLLAPAREQVLTTLVELCASDPARAAEVLGLGPTQADDVRRNAALSTARTARADAVYTGVLYDALDLASLDSSARRRATRWLAITSSLFGLVSPGDRIPSYRLPGATSLPGLGPVAQTLHDLRAVVEQHGFLVGVIVEKGSARDVAGPRDVGRGGRLKAPTFEQVEGHAVDPRAAAFFLTLPERRRIHTAHHIAPTVQFCTPSKGVGSSGAPGLGADAQGRVSVGLSPCAPPPPMLRP